MEFLMLSLISSEGQHFDICIILYFSGNFVRVFVRVFARVSARSQILLGMACVTSTVTFILLPTHGHFRSPLTAFLLIL